jgi:hypothetical protein
MRMRAHALDDARYLRTDARYSLYHRVVTKNLTPGKGLCYFVSQCLGALVGGGILRGAVGSTRYMSGIGLSPDLTQFGGCICEFMGTFLLIFTVFFVAVEHSMRNDAEDGLDMGSNSSTITALAPLPIGFSVLIAHLTLAPLTGCGINPARWVGAVVWQSDYDYGAAWIYWVGPFLASFLAPLTYYALYGTTHSSDAKGAKFTDDSPSATEPALRSIRRVSATGEPVLRLPPVSAEALKVSPL